MANKKPLVLDVNNTVVQQIQAADLVDPVALGTGAASSANFLRGDGAWATPPGTIASYEFSYLMYGGM